jgi:alkylation response protein AidB-like acyl-CoA dehydrogenase
MELAFSKEDEKFRDEVRAFIAERFDEDLRHKMACSKNGYLDKAGQVKWQKALHDRGWIAVNWTKEYGGPGFTTNQKYIFDGVWQRGAEEKASAADPVVGRVVVPGLFGTRIRFGSCQPEHARRGQGRSLPLQWHKDLDDACAVGRLDLLSCTNHAGEETAGGHLVHPD